MQTRMDTKNQGKRKASHMPKMQKPLLGHSKEEENKKNQRIRMKDYSEFFTHGVANHLHKNV